MRDAGHSLGVIPPARFTTLAVTAVVTTLLTEPMPTLLQGETRLHVAMA